MEFPWTIGKSWYIYLTPIRWIYWSTPGTCNLHMAKNNVISHYVFVRIQVECGQEEKWQVA